MKLRLLHIILCLLLLAPVQAQDTLQVNRDAEDFVTASLLVAAPGDMLYSILGHACLRMQCPTFNMDYCFSYENEGFEGNIGKFLCGNLKMGMTAVPTQEYLQYYAGTQRGVWEYELNLPIAVKRELWRVLDNRLMEGIYLPYDYLKRGCAIACVKAVKEALDTLSITYAPFPHNIDQHTFWEIYYHYAHKGWDMFWCATMIGGGVAQQEFPAEQNLIIPAQLAEVWQEATVCGVPLLSEATQLLPNTLRQYTWFTPLVAAIVMLVLSMLNLFWKKPYWDWAMLLLHTLMGCLLIFLTLFSTLPGTEWNWLIIPFFPLPALLWRWRSKWALPYAALLFCWCIGVLVPQHQLVMYAHLLWVISFTLILIKQSTWWNNTIAKLCTQKVKL